MKNKINHLEAIIFDLDDTLIDTHALLINQLEFKSAQKMVQIEPSLPSPDELTALLLEIRRKAPGRIEEEIQKRVPGITGNILEARRSVFKKISLNGLFIDPGVKLLLETLKRNYHLYLVTEGDTDFQNSKIGRLGIRSLFKEIVIISKDSKESKEGAMQTLLKKNHYVPGAVLVVGNRLDREICAAARLGMPTVWIKHGEGCDMSPDRQAGFPDFIVENILKLPEAINRLATEGK